MAQERRQYKRIDEQHLVAYVTRTQDQGATDEGMALAGDFSLAGIQLKLPRMAQVGDHLDLTFNIQQDLFSVVGEIVWIKPQDLGCDAGVQIISVPADYADRIRLLLENAEPVE